MALAAQNYNRPKLTATLTENFTPVAALADDSAQTAVVNIYATVNSATKLLARIKLGIEVSGVSFRVSMQSLTFPGNAANYSAGVNTPPDSAANSTGVSPVYYSSTVDLDAFYTAAGDTRADS